MTTRWTDSSGKKARSRESPLISRWVVASIYSHKGRQMADKDPGAKRQDKKNLQTLYRFDESAEKPIHRNILC